MCSFLQTFEGFEVQDVVSFDEQIVEGFEDRDGRDVGCVDDREGAISNVSGSLCVQLVRYQNVSQVHFLFPARWRSRLHLDQP